MSEIIQVNVGFLFPFFLLSSAFPFSPSSFFSLLPLLLLFFFNLVKNYYLEEGGLCYENRGDFPGSCLFKNIINDIEILCKKYENVHIDFCID